MSYISKAREFYNEHTAHIDRIIKSCEGCHEPSKEDLYFPELWKPASWNWFFNDGLDNVKIIEDIEDVED